MNRNNTMNDAAENVELIIVCWITEPKEYF